MTENEKAAKEIADEKAKYGFGEKPAEDSQLDEDSGDLDDDTEEGDSDDEVEDESEDLSDDEDSEDENDESDDDEGDEDEEEDEDDSEKDQTQKKNKRGVVPFKAYNEQRKELRAALEKIENLENSNKDLESKLPDDFKERAMELAKEIGVENPEGLQKILAFMKEAVVDKNTKGLEDRLAKMEIELKKNNQPVDEFPAEWDTFKTKTLKSEFPNATPEQLKAVKVELEKLAKNPKTGGKIYKHESGQNVLDPYPLEYIFWQNKSKFSSLVTGKKVRSMETSKTQRHDGSKDREVEHLSKNSPTSDIRALDKKYARLEAGLVNTRSPEDNSI